MFLTVHAELHEIAACMRHGPCCTEGIVAVDVSHLDKGRREFLDVLGICPELIAISILALALLLDVEVGGSPAGGPYQELGQRRLL